MPPGALFCQISQVDHLSVDLSNRKKTVMRSFAIIAVLLVIIPLAIGGTWFTAQGWPSSWNTADWSATGMAPHPKTEKEAIIQVYAARAGRWKGIVAVHTWLIFKPKNGSSFTRYDVVGWGRPVRRNAFPVDGNWYSNRPEVIYEVKGPKADRLIPKIIRSINNYPNSERGSYKVWPGPNSNSFIAWIARAVPELGVELPPTAIGKDYLGTGINFGTPPSGTGWQVSLNGILGMAIGFKEGLEFHLLGATIGIDFQDLALKLPSLGKLSLRKLTEF